MSYRFDIDESVREALVRCAHEQLDDAVRELSEEVDEDPVEAVHSARKAVKKERALLRLARGTLAGKQRKRENAALRDAARQLSGARDAEVMLETLGGLADRFAGRLPEGTFDAVRKQLERTRRSERSRVLDSPLTTEAAKDLDAVRVRIDDWKLKRDGWGALDSGLARTYRRGRQGLRRARKEPSFENLHEWRKRVKDLWYELRLLAPAGGPTIKGQVNEAHRLADLLGDDHDLGVLRQTLVQLDVEITEDLDPLLALVDHRREELQTEARHAGARLYAEKPKAFQRRIRRCWKAGHDEVRAVAGIAPAGLPRSRPRSLSAAGAERTDQNA